MIYLYFDGSWQGWANYYWCNQNYGLHSNANLLLTTPGNAFILYTNTKDIVWPNFTQHFCNLLTYMDTWWGDCLIFDLIRLGIWKVLFVISRSSNNFEFCGTKHKVNNRWSMELKLLFSLKPKSNFKFIYESNFLLLTIN